MIKSNKFWPNFGYSMSSSFPLLKAFFSSECGGNNLQASIG